MTTVDDIPTIDLAGEAYQADPEGVCAEALRTSWVARTDWGPIVLGSEEAHVLLKDPRTSFSGRAIASLFGIVDGWFHDFWVTHLLNLEGDEHARLRKLVSRTFTGRHSEQARPIMREVLTDLLEPLLPTGRCDVVTDISSQFPIRILCRLIGIPDADVDRFTGWAHQLGEGMSMNLDQIIGDLNDAVEGLWTYVDGVIAERSSMADPPDDLIQALVSAAPDGDRLAPTEARMMIVLLLAAGYDTTATQLSRSVAALVKEPDVWSTLASDPSSAPGIVQELLRYTPAVATTSRLIHEDVEINGVVFPAGTFVLVSLSAANRDPRMFDRPDQLDPSRTDAHGHSSFGLGHHYCIGASLARAQLEEALVMMATTLGPIRADGPAVFTTPQGLAGVQSLPIAFAPHPER